MGRKAVPVERIELDQKRRNTFKKRLLGLMKKIHDLSILCDAQIAAVVIDENKEIFPFTNNETIEEVWNEYFAKDAETKSERLSECKKALETETKKIEMACRAKKKSKKGIHQKVRPHRSTSQNIGVENGVHHQPNWNINSNTQQYQTSPRNTSSSMANLQTIGFNATNQERNYNNWSNDTNGVNHEIIHHVNEMYQNGNNHQGYGYNIEVKGHEVQHHQSQAKLRDPQNHPINVNDNHLRYGNNVEVRQHEVCHPSLANLHDPLDNPIDMDDNHRGYGDNVEDQRLEVCHPSSALLQDPLDCPIDMDAFEKAHLPYMSLNVKSSYSEVSKVIESIPSFGDLSTTVTSTPSTRPSILPRDDPSIMPPCQEDTLCTRPLHSKEWELEEDLGGLDLEDWNKLEDWKALEAMEDIEPPCMPLIEEKLSSPKIPLH